MEDLGAVPTAGEFLREMPLKAWMTGINAKQKARMQNLTIEGDGSREAYIKAEVKWEHKNNVPIKSGVYLICNEKGACLFSTYSKETNSWDAEVTYWSYPPTTPICND